MTRSRVTPEDYSQCEQDETVVFDNLQSQDDVAGDGGSSDALKGPLSFTVDDCPLGHGVTEIVRSMTMGEQCEAWLDPQYGPGEMGSGKGSFV